MCAWEQQRQEAKAFGSAIKMSTPHHGAHLLALALWSSPSFLLIHSMEQTIADGPRGWLQEVTIKWELFLLLCLSNEICTLLKEKKHEAQ